MLSSRYLHLHEALGLGPMWLAQGAVFRPSENAAAPAKLAPIPAAVSATARSMPAAPQAVRSLSPAAHQARQAAVAAVKQPAPAAPKTLPETAAETKPQPDAEPFSADTPRLHIAVRPARLMAVAPCPAPEDLLQGIPFSGQTGILLDNMLAAVGLNPQQVHKTVWLKSTPPFAAEPDAAALAQELAAMQAELAGCGAQAVLLLGQAFSLPDHAEAAAQLCGSLPCFTVPHPARLLRQPHLKAQAWQELKRLRTALAQEQA